MATILADPKATGMKQRVLQLAILLVILCLAAVIRFWQLGIVPAGPNWDEAAIGYNGWSVWKIHRDEWLNFMPVSFRSFGDYKAPFAIYLNGLFTSLFGLSASVVRLPFAIISLLAIAGMGFLANQLRLLEQKRWKLSAFGLTALAMVLMTLSPWHILFSRVGFESGIVLAQTIWATALLFLSQKRHSWQKLLLLLLSAGLFALSLYTYHSAKIMVPLFIVGLSLMFVKKRLLKLTDALFVFVSAAVLLLPLVYDSVFGSGLARASVTIFAQAENIVQLLQMLSHNIIAQFELAFLLFGAADSARHSIGTMGVLTISTFVLCLIGLAVTLRARTTAGLLALLWLIAGMIPAIIGVEVPHPNRALLALPGFLLLALVGLNWLVQHYRASHRYRWHFGGILVVLVILEIAHSAFFLKQYFGAYAWSSSELFQDGYIQVFSTIWQYTDGSTGRAPVDQVVMTNEYGQPYIFALFSRQIDPIAYHNGALVTFLFPDQVTLSDLDRDNTLVVAGEKSDLIDRSKAFEVVRARDGRPMFWLFDTNAL